MAAGTGLTDQLWSGLRKLIAMFERMQLLLAVYHCILTALPTRTLDVQLSTRPPVGPLNPTVAQSDSFRKWT